MAVKKKLFLIIGIILSIILIFVLGMFVFFKTSLKAVDKNNKTPIEVVIPSGSTTTKIATILKEKDLIRNEFVFKLYLKIKKANSLKATTYQMNKTMNVEKIVNMLEKGNSYNPEQIKITFKEGQRITDYAEEIGTKTNRTPDEVLSIINNKDNII